jgi:hypothetical protein
MALAPPPTGLYRLHTPSGERRREHVCGERKKKRERKRRRRKRGENIKERR